ncbi:rho GTPase-activating protein 39 isoform X2 [Leguminivora glycinivorella]|uniref:rho GTPase-activating protein 39 isoform X2 n=1 Tax=Leguminivora glycinivorella TaxID=1035111 RepID=UPI00200E23CF|nr:rho GTPase-activating protein 39 isoform X2 [Leguminivora glycinivorella]
MTSERVEWVEIIEPKTKEHMYANLTTGECVWDPPEGVKVKRTDSSQWWELFDINTHRFYYYNASTQTTVWHRPTDCDIIPLAKLQTLKQNTDPQKRRESATQTNQAAPQAPSSIDPVSSNGNTTAASASKLSPSNTKNVSLPQTSPVRTRRSHYHHRNSGERRGRLSEDGASQLCRHTDSGRSSDSSVSSQRRKQQELAAAACAPVCTPQLRKRSGPAPPLEADKWSPHAGLNRSGSFISPRKDASDDSMHEKYFKSVESTPLTKRKLKQQSTGSSCESASPQSPSSPLQKPQPQPFLQTSAARPSLVSSISLATDAAGGSRVMHSLERPHQLSRHARERYSDRHLDKDRLVELERAERFDKQAAYSVDKPFRQTSLDLRHHAPNWHPPREFTRQQAEPERYTSSKSSLSSGSSKRQEPHHNFMRLCSANEQDNMAAVNYKMKCINLDPPLTEPNVQKHNQRLERSTAPRDRAKSRRHKRPEEVEESPLDADEEDDEGSPLYCNWDLRGMQHLLPLQDYIIQQAKLSRGGRYADGSGSDNESNSSRSRSGSRGSRSLSGHEPDNESSDGGARTPDDDDGSGVYLSHQHAEYMNHGVAYYNTFHEPDKEYHRPVAGAEALYSPVRAHAPRPPEQDIEIFAKDHLNFNKGIFRKKASVRDMLSWTSSGISAPMVGADWDKAHKKAATDLFRLVQIYMGDRKARPGMTLNSVAQDLLHATFANEKLRDELYVQLCRQTTENPLRDSLLRGWELLAVCLAFVPPSPAFQPALTNYVNRHRDPAFADAFPEVGKWPIHVQVSHYAGVACKRLERIGVSGKRQPRKPTTEDIDQARIQIFRQSMFGNTLSEVMALQKERFPNRQLPWVQVALSQQVLALSGRETEGIFRVSADVDEVAALKAKIDNWELPDASTLTDAHAPASLLKLWYRELYEPLIPDALYAPCVAAGSDYAACSRALQRLPALNRLVLTYLISFLQQFTAPEVVSQTKMDSANLAMVFAPNCLRCTSQDPRVILENARKEMTFLKTLITNLDTSHVQDML